MSLEVIAINSDNLVRLDSLTNASSGAFVNNATVSFSLLDSTGNTIISNSSMAYVTGSNGRYEGTIPFSTTINLNALYTIQVTAVGAGFQIFRKLSCIGKYRSNQ
jgi:hypothetical protein